MSTQLFVDYGYELALNTNSIEWTTYHIWCYMKPMNADRRLVFISQPGVPNKFSL